MWGGGGGVRGGQGNQTNMIFFFRSLISANRRLYFWGEGKANFPKKLYLFFK